MYKYTEKLKLKSGTAWKFKPPQDAIDAGIVVRKTFYDGRAARYEIPRLVQKVVAFRNGALVAGNIGPMSNLAQIYKYYINTKHFKDLSFSSQKSYINTLSGVLNTQVSNTTMGRIRIKNLTAMQCKEAYEVWSNGVSVSKANQCSRLLSVIINFCISLDMIQHNPLSRIKKQHWETTSIVWQPAQVISFLDTCFTDFKWRNIGLIAFMCYEWAQRPNDIRLLKWSSVDLDNKRVTIKQTKRGATVELPMTDEIVTMLQQQKKDWDFQEYVVPFHRPSDNAYIPLKREQVSSVANEVKKACCLPSELKIGNLRKSGIVEMIDAGVDHLVIMSVTGHKNIQSLNPYQKHTYAAAKSALDRRKQGATHDK
jgi:integrase